MKENRSGWLGRLMSEWVSESGNAFWCRLMLLLAVGYLLVVWSFSLVSGIYIPILAFMLVGAANVYALSQVGRVSHLVSAAGEDAGRNCERWLFVCMMFVYALIAFFAPQETPDTVWQWTQAVGALPYDDWHPVAHTWLLTAVRFFVRKHSFVLLVQAACLVWLLRSLHLAVCAAGVKRTYSLCAIAIVGLSPFTLSMVSILLKDTALALCVLGITVMLAKIVEGKDSWFDIKRAILLAVLIAYAAFVRHNGIFYAIPLVVLLPIGTSAQNRKLAVLTSCLAVALMGGYIAFRGSLKSSGVVEECRGGQNFAESVGLPMSMMAECYVHHEELTPVETRLFLEMIADRDVWVDKFDGTYNSVKFHSVTNAISVLGTATTPQQFLKLFIDTVRSYPISAIKSFLYITQQAWSPCPDHLTGAVAIGGGIFAYNISSLSVLVLRSPIGFAVIAPGFFMMCLVIAFFWRARTALGKALLYVIPVAAYHFGTMFFLTGWDWRFFYPTIAVAYPLALLLLKCEKRHT